jgi:dienelactone hydrolase
MGTRVPTHGDEIMLNSTRRTKLRAAIRSTVQFLLAAAIPLACAGDARDVVGPASEPLQRSIHSEGDEARAVKGRVINSATGNPVAGAEVRIGTAAVTTGPSGHFKLDAPEGESALRAFATGFADFETAITPTDVNARQDIALTRIEVFEFGVFALYVPANVDEVNGVILALGGPDTRAFATGKRFGAPIPAVEASLQLLGQDLRALASSLGLAILGSSRVNLALPNSPDSDQLLLGAVETAAAMSGRGDLSTAPFLVYGLSGGAREASGFTARNPERVAGLFLKVPAGASTLTSAEALAVPTYVVLAELDVLVDNTAITAAFEANRAAGALWGLAMEPGVVHHSLSAVQREVTIGWMSTILERRLAPHQWSGPLRDIAETDGWLGNRETREAAPWATYTGNRATASWLPSERTAMDWEALVRGGVIATSSQEPSIR